MRILELSRDLSASFAGLLLAEMGADVVKVEPPEGERWRQRRDDVPDDLSFEYLNRRKRGVTIDLAKRAGRQLFLRLAAGADAVVEDLGPGEMAALRLLYRSLKRAKPDLILTSISPFGAEGPWSGWQASELVLQATGGVMASTGWADSPPAKLAGQVAHHIAGLNAAIATLAAVYGARSGLEGGVHIDVSAQETFAPHWARHISQYAYAGMSNRRAPRGNGRQGFPDHAMAEDGPIYLLALRAEWESFAYFLGLEQFITPEFSDPQSRLERWSEIEPHFRKAVASKSRYQWFAEGAEHGYTFAPMDDPFSLVQSPQLLARGYFRQTETPAGERVPSPGLPVPFAAAPLRKNRVPALGEHNDELFGELGLSPQEIAGLKARRVI